MLSTFMLTYISRDYRADRKVTPLELVDSLRITESFLQYQESVPPPEGMSRFCYYAMILTYKTPYLQLELLASFAEEECASGEEAKALYSQILDYLEQIVETLLKSEEYPEVLCQAYVGVCDLLPDLYRDCAGGLILARGYDVLHLARVHVNPELFYHALFTLAYTRHFCEEEYSELQGLACKLVTLFYTVDNPACFLILDFLAAVIRIQPSLKVDGLPDDSLAQLVLLIIRRPRGSIHTAWEQFLETYLNTNAAAALLLYAAQADVSMDTSEGYSALYCIFAFIYKKYATSEVVYASMTTCLLSTKLPFAELRDYNVFADSLHFQALLYCNELRVQFAPIPDALLTFFLADYNRFAHYAELYSSALADLTRYSKAALWHYMLDAMSSTADISADYAYLCLAVFSHYLDMELDVQNAYLCMQAAIRVGAAEVQAFLLAYGVADIYERDAELYTPEFHLCALDSAMVIFYHMLAELDPARFCLYAAYFAKKEKTDQDIEELRTAACGPLSSAIYRNLSSKYTRIRRATLDTLTQFLDFGLLHSLARVHVSRDFRFIQDLIVNIKIKTKAAYLAPFELEFAAATAVGFVYYRNGIVYEHFFDLMQAFHAYNAQLFAEIIKSCELCFWQDAEFYENVLLEDLLASSSGDHFHYYSEDIDPRIIKRIGKDVSALLCKDAAAIERYYQTVIAFMTKPNDALQYAHRAKAMLSFGERFGSIADANARLSLPIIYIRTRLIAGAWKPAWKQLVAINPQTALQILQETHYLALNSIIIDLHRIRFILYAILADIGAFGHETVECLSKMCKFSVFEALLPEMAFLCCVLGGVQLPWVIARLINLNTVQAYLGHTFATSGEYTRYRVLQGTYRDFEIFYSMCTNSDYQAAKDQSNFRVDLNFGALDDDFRSLFINLLVSRATRSARSQSITGSGYAHVGRVGNEAARKRRVVYFVHQTLGPLQKEFYNGYLLTVFKGLFDTSDILAFVEGHSVDELIATFSGINTNALHSYLQTLKSMDQDEDMEFPFVYIAKLMYALTKWLHGLNNFVYVAETQTIYYCLAFSAKILAGVTKGLILGDNLLQTDEDKRLAESIVHFTCAYFPTVEALQAIVCAALEDKNKYSYLKMVQLMALPLLAHFSTYAQQIKAIFETTQHDARAVSALSDQIHKMIRQKTQAFDLTHFFAVMQFIAHDEEITEFCLRRDVRDSAFDYLAAYDFCEFEKAVLYHYEHCDYFKRLFTASQMHNPRYSACASLLSATPDSQSVALLLQTNDYIVYLVFFHAVTLCDDKLHLLGMLSKYYIELFSGFVSAYMLRNAQLKLSDYLRTLYALSSLESAGTLDFPDCLRSVKYAQASYIAYFVQYLQECYTASEDAIAQHAEILARFILPFLTLCVHRLKNMRLGRQCAVFITALARYWPARAFLTAIVPFSALIPVLCDAVIDGLLLDGAEALTQQHGDSLARLEGASELAGLVQCLVDPLRLQTKIGPILKQGYLNLRAFDVFVRITAAVCSRQISELVQGTIHNIIGLLLTGNHERRQLALECAKILVRYFGQEAARLVLHFMLQQAGASHHIFYITNTAYCLLTELLVYVNPKKQALVTRGQLSKEMLKLCLNIVQRNLFSNAQQVRHSDLFNKMVKDDYVYELITILVAAVEYNSSEETMLGDVIMPLLMKSRDYKTGGNGIKQAIRAGMARNTGFHLKEAVQLALYLLNDDKCRYCRCKPQHHSVFIDRRQQILDNEKLTGKEKQIYLQNVHQLLDNALQPYIHDSYITLIKDISYDPYMCIWLSLAALTDVFANQRYVVVGQQENASMARYVELKSGSQPDFAVYYSFAADVNEYKERLQVVFDYAIYCGNQEVTELLYACLSRYLTFYKQLSRKFIVQAINQLDFIVSSSLKQQIFETLLTLAEERVLGDDSELKLLMAAVVHSKLMNEMLVYPFKVILRYYQLFYDKYADYLNAVAEFYLRNSIFKLGGDKSGEICDTMSRILSYYYAVTENYPNPMDLLKIAVESELLEPRIMALRTLQRICKPRQLVFVREKGLIGLLPARYAATGVICEDLREEIARTFVIFQGYADLSQFGQFLQAGGRFFTIAANLLLEVLQTEDFQLDGSVVSTDNAHRDIKKLVATRRYVCEEVLKQSQDRQKAAVACLGLCSMCNIEVEIPLWAFGEETMLQSVVEYYKSRKSFPVDQIAQNSSQLISRYARELGHLATNPLALINVLSTNPAALLELLANWVQFDEEKVLVHGRALVSSTSSMENRDSWLEYAQRIIGVDEVFEYICGK